jgi:hypothetical protein
MHEEIPPPRERRRQMAMRLAPIDTLQRYEISEAACYLRISPAKVWADIAAGKIRVIREGAAVEPRSGRGRKSGRTYVPGSELARLCRVPESSSAA